MNAAHKSVPRTRLGPWYILKAETVGVQSCPVHGAQGKVTQGIKASEKHPRRALSTPALLKDLSAAPGARVSTTPPGRQTHSSVPAAPPAPLVERKHNMFARGPGQWSGRAAKTKHVTEVEDPLNANKGFQRRWSFRRPSLTPDRKPSDVGMSFEAPTMASLSRKLGETIPEYFEGVSTEDGEKKSNSVKKYSSYENFNFPASSLRTMSIPLKVCKFKEETLHCLTVFFFSRPIEGVRMTTKY